MALRDLPMSALGKTVARHLTISARSGLGRELQLGDP